MSTYSQLKATVLRLVDSVGSTTIGSVVEDGLHQGMCYIAQQTQLADLIGQASYTWLANDTEVALGASGFDVLADYETPIELWVHAAGEDGLRYVFRDYLAYRRLKNVYDGSYDGISLSSPKGQNELPESGAFTIDPDNNVQIYPLPKEDQVVTFFYEKAPAAYADAGIPELPAKWQTMLVYAAQIYTRSYIEEQVVNTAQLFESLRPQIEDFERSYNSRRRSGVLRVSSKYPAQ